MAGCVQPTGYATYPGHIGHHVNRSPCHTNGAEQALPDRLKFLGRSAWNSQFARYLRRFRPHDPREQSAPRANRFPSFFQPPFRDEWLPVLVSGLDCSPP